MSNFLLDPAIAIYAALSVALVVWIGVFAFLWRLDRQARELRRQIDQRPRAEAPAPHATLEPRGVHPQPRVATNDE
jgi:CcmD family protein